MAVNLSIKNVPEDVVERLRYRAQQNHRSMQGELRAILDEAVGPAKITSDNLYERVQELGLKTPSESVQMIREDRDAG